MERREYHTNEDEGISIHVNMSESALMRNNFRGLSRLGRTVDAASAANQPEGCFQVFQGIGFYQSGGCPGGERHGQSSSDQNELL